MIEWMSAYSALKESFSLWKTAKEAVNDIERNLALGELYEKLSLLQFKYGELSEMYLSEKQKVVELSQIVSLVETYIEQAPNYKSFTTEAGAFVYRFDPPEESEVHPHYACTSCFHKRKISVLQPRTNSEQRHKTLYCHDCNAEYLFERNIMRINEDALKAASTPPSRTR
ncbi:hypothetical protein F3J34_30450 [Klebsiella sp. Ap-873]|nr:hypothetical protein [Klebsiella sp. Ap-873]